MTCPICGGKTKIYDSRPDEESVRRRRECVECGHRFITVEVDADLFERVEKNNVVEVVETKKVPENCATCMYGRMCGCTHADRQKDWKRYVDFTWLDNKCPSFRLDQDRYNAVKK